MCLSKVLVRDLIRKERYNYFDCGKCKSCLQKKANRRSSKIRNHHPEDFICFFITLSYSNKYVPYVKRDDFISANRDLAVCHSVDVPIYRHYYFRKNAGVEVSERCKRPVGYLTLDTRFPENELSSLSGLREKASSRTFRYYQDKISVAYTPDIQKFLKRFRQNLFRAYKKRVPLTYYYAPEYGPTTQRFHAHLLLWLPSWFSEQMVRYELVEAWPYADGYRTKDFCEVARNPARYVASYVNSDSTVSHVLKTWAPLRPSHSLGFGFDNQYFTLASVLAAYGNKSYKFPIVRMSETGAFVSDNVIYPARVKYRYFPKVKGFSRCSRDTLFHAYTNPEKYFALSPISCGKTPSGDKLFMSNLVDVFGNPVPMTLSYCDYFVNYVKRTYLTYYQPLNISYYDACRIMIDYNIGFSLALYSDSQIDKSMSESLHSFFNLYFALSELKAPTIYPYVINSEPTFLDCNTYYEECVEEIRLLDQYNKNIKQRKINSL